jgi:hypothetical protein
MVVLGLWGPLSCTGRDQSLSGAVYTGVVTGAFWGLFERTCLHEAHDDRKIRVWLFFGGKAAAIVAAACLVGRLLLYIG